MTPKEFETEYKRLIAVLPQTFDNQVRKALISRTVGPLNAKWWAGLVDQIILANNPRFDIDAAARSERNALRGLRATREVSQAIENFEKNISDSGLGDTLEKFKAKSLWEAIEKTKGESNAR